MHRWLGVTLLLLAGCTGPGPLEFGVRFGDARGLEEGDPVLLRGVEIGAVRAIELEPRGAVLVRLRVEPEYREAPYREARYRVARVSGPMGLAGERCLLIEDVEGPRTPLLGGERLDGWEPAGVGSLEGLRRLWQRGGEAVGGAWEELSRLASDPEVRERLEAFREQLEQTASELDSAAREEWESFVREQLPALERQAGELADWLERQGYPGLARAIEDGFESWRAAVVSEAPGEPPLEAPLPESAEEDKL